MALAAKSAPMVTDAPVRIGKIEWSETNVAAAPKKPTASRPKPDFSLVSDAGNSRDTLFAIASFKFAVSGGT